MVPGFKVAQVRVRSGGLIDSLEFVMADGAVRNGGYASPGGQPQPTFDLEPDEHVVRLETKQEGANLVGLRIHTSKGRESQWYGGQDGTAEEFSGSAEDPIVGFERAADGFCTKIVRVRRLQDAESAAPKPESDAAAQVQAPGERSVESAQPGAPADGSADPVSDARLCSPTASRFMFTNSFDRPPRIPR